MPLDGAFIHCLRAELKTAVNCHIDKIHCPAKNEFVFSLRGKGFSKKLYISLNPDSPRVGFSTLSYDNPAVPPMFCMLLRKHLSSGKIIDINGLGAERIIIFSIEATNEMGDRVPYRMIIELTGHKTNLILVNSNGKIIDSARRSDIETSERLILPGALYSPPPTDNRIDFLDGDLLKAAQKCLANNVPLSDAIIKNIAGISPLICREISLRVTGDNSGFTSSASVEKLYLVLENLKNEALNGGTPYIITDNNKYPKDYSFTKIQQYGNIYTLNRAESFSSALEDFYKEREHTRRIEHAKSDLIKLVKNLIARNDKKLNLRKNELEKSESKDELRVFGELLKANIFRIKRGAPSVLVENYYDPEFKKVTIPLNIALSPQANAAKYFKEYKKACTAGQTLVKLITECEAEGEYLNSVLFELQSADTIAVLSEIRNELTENGYIKRKEKISKTQKNLSKPLCFTKNEFKILVGRNNTQNDTLTLKTASKNDIWFHTKNIHGSHVILFTEGKKPDEDTLFFAACLAAKYSKAADSNQVPVDYTSVKYVKKPVGAKPGMVIYATNQTIFANPKAITQIPEKE